MDKVIDTKYCILENDGVSLCVCKHRPCEQLQRLEQENEKLNIYRQCLQEIREYIGTCCHRFSENHKNICFGCEYDKEVCDYSIILDKINLVIGVE